MALRSRAHLAQCLQALPHARTQLGDQKQLYLMSSGRCMRVHTRAQDDCERRWQRAGPGSLMGLANLTTGLCLLRREVVRVLLRAPSEAAL